MSACEQDKTMLRSIYEISDLIFESKSLIDSPSRNGFVSLAIIHFAHTITFSKKISILRNKGIAP